MDSSFKDHLRLDPKERRNLLRRLDQVPEQVGNACRRRHTRYEYRALDLAVSVLHPGGGESRLLVCSRNLSAGGVAFLHGGYLHPGSDCRLMLMRRDGKPIALMGTVRHCRHLQGSCHEIGLQFAQEIDPHAILMPTELEETEEQSKLDRSVQIPSLSGQLLLVDDSVPDRRLLMHQLSATGLRLMSVETSGAALDAVKLGQFDAVICGLDLTHGGGIYAVEQMRAAGFAGPIVVLTAEVKGEELAQVRQAGATEVIGKPYDPSYIMYLVGEVLHQASLDTPIYSRFDDEDGLGELLVDYICETKRLAARLEKVHGEGDLSAVREACLRLSGSGGPHGFDQVSVAAQDVLRNLAACDDPAEASGAVRRLVTICGRLCCSHLDEERSLPARKKAPKSA